MADWRVWLVLLGLFAGLASGACTRTVAVGERVERIDDGAVAMRRESDPQFAREALPASLKGLEATLVSRPDDDELLRHLAHGYFTYAFGFLEQDINEAQIALADQARVVELTDRAILHYRRAREYGFRLLGRPAFREAAVDVDVARVDSLLAEMGEDDVPGLYWTAAAWGAMIHLDRGDAEMREALPVVERMMRRVVELDASYQNWGPHVFLGVFHASRPKGEGGDPEQARKHFETALEGAGERNLMIPFLYGRYYGPQTDDRELFDRMMQKVETADLGGYPDQRLNNEIAQERAAFWSEHADELFY